MNQTILRKYASVILETGVNLQPGENLLIRTDPIHWEAVVIIAEEAYRRGARYVRTDPMDHLLDKARVSHSKAEYLSYVPPYFEQEINSIIQGNWCRIYIDGFAYPDIFKSVEPARLSELQKATSASRKPLMKASVAGLVPWCACALPTPGWAAKVFHQEPSEELSRRLWEVLLPILKLDQEDPSAAWQKQAETLKRRSKTINDLKCDHLHFEGPGTDLRVGLAPGSIWEGGFHSSPDNRCYLPNIPTEEIFTTPDFRRTEGSVQVTRPVRVLENQVIDAWFEFADGRVKEFGAGAGRQWLEQYFEIEEASRYLGEVALVDSSSPIYRSGCVFESILFDENAACHIALGSGYANAIDGGLALSDEELKQTGCNVSVVHTDFMIGSEQVSVTGISKEGKRHPIIKNGEFVI